MEHPIQGRSKPCAATRRDIKRKADFIVNRWHAAEKNEEELAKLFPSKKSRAYKLPCIVSALREADSFLKVLLKISSSRDFPKFYLSKGGGPDGKPFTALEILAAGGLAWFADWLAALKRSNGRPREWAKAACAQRLSQHFERHIEKPSWHLVYDCMRKRWPDYFPDVGDNRTKRDRLMRLVKNASKRDRKGNFRLAKINTKPFPLPAHAPVRRLWSKRKYITFVRHAGLAFKEAPKSGR